MLQHVSWLHAADALQAETRFQLADYKGTAAAYEQAMAVAPSIDLLQNLAAAYVNDGKPQAAIDAVKAAGQHLPSSLVTVGYGESELSLLLGRIYAQWPGHDGQALDVYDKLIQKNPDDFRQVTTVICSLLSFVLASITYTVKAPCNDARYSDNCDTAIKTLENGWFVLRMPSLQQQ